MANKQTWLDEGLTVLAELGLTALRIDRLAERLHLSKGSFYHHFAGITGFRLDLLAYYEAKCTTMYIDAVETHSHLGPSEKLSLLQDLVLRDDQFGPDIEVVMRAWAAQDDDARATQQRIDATRIGYLRSLLREMISDEQEATDTASMIYLLLIGAQHVLPATTSTELGRLYDLTLGRTGRKVIK